jgi:hypothetical protein
MTLRSRDFKSLMSTNSITRALDCIDSAAIKMRQDPGKGKLNQPDEAGFSICIPQSTIYNKRKPRRTDTPVLRGVVIALLGTAPIKESDHFIGYQLLDRLVGVGFGRIPVKLDLLFDLIDNRQPDFRSGVDDIA